MEFSMVNSSSIGSERNGNPKASCMQTNGLHNKTSSPLTASSATQAKNDFNATVGSEELSKTLAVEPTPSLTKLEDHKAEDYDYVLSHNIESSNSINKSETNETKKTLFCSLPLEKVQTILSKYTSFKSDGNKMKGPRKVLCLYCDRTFVNVNLRQKHVERCHSSKQLRRVSLRKHQNFLTSTPCIYCDKFSSTEHTLKDLFKHLVENHSNKYFGCVACEIRFLNSSHFADHNALCHNTITIQDVTPDSRDLASPIKPTNSEKQPEDVLSTKPTRRRQKIKRENKIVDVNTNIGSNIEETNKTTVKNLRNKKLSVKSSRMILKRSKRLQAKTSEPPKRKRRDLNEKKKKNERTEQISEKSTKTTSSFVNPYPEFDHFFQVKKITDHSIDNLKISSLTFDDVFDKAFFNRIKCNIQENLLHHIDGKLFKNEESESRISNFEKISNIPQEMQNLNTENYGCEISLNAVAPTTMLLSNQLGDDPESQIEYGSKPSKKKTQMKKDEVHYKYFTRRKYQASILEHKENRDLSKLDMWTQYIIKNRQQKILDDKKSPKEILDYFAGEEYKSMMRREELNRILDRRGPFEDLREEVSKQAALDKMNGENTIPDDHFTEIGELLNDILNRVFELAKDPYPSAPTLHKRSVQIEEVNIPEIPSYLNLRPTTDVIPEDEIDRSDKIALICSSQETENFELPGNTVRGKNEKVELTGEWARSRIFVCAACGLKLQNIKQFLEHKSASHQYIWVQHYEFVGNQSELYTHLSIPVLGKVGVLENVVQCKVWKRSDARSCTKCGKQCNSLGELHRHILECGGDWTWMLARKKCKYRPFGAKSRRKRRGLVKRIYAPKTEPTEKKVYKKSYDIPRQKPSDADTIKRMLANLPAKRATRKIISLKDGFNTTRTRQVKTTQQTKFKCGKLIRGKTKEQNGSNKTEFEKTKNNTNNNHRRSLRSLNKVLTSRILDTNNSLIVRRKYNRKIKNEQKRNVQIEANETDSNMTKEQSSPKISPRKLAKTNNNGKTQVDDNKQINEESKSKRSSPRIEKRLEFTPTTDKMNIKRFFPVKKRKRVNNTETVQDTGDTKNFTITNESLQDDSQKKEEITTQPIQKNINLRKRKNEKSTEANTSTKTKVRKTTITRTRRRNTTKTVTTELNLEASKVEDNPKKQEEINLNETEEKTFFEETNSEKKSELITLAPVDNKEKQIDDSIEEELVKIENLHIKEEVDVNFFSKENNSEHVESNSQTFRVSPSKRKVRKPTRGLNDCIAMLTSKLGKSFEESTSHNVFNDEVPDPIQIDKNSEFILKVPFSNEHFQLRSSNKENECLQTSSNLSENTCEIVDKKNVDNEIISEKIDLLEPENNEKTKENETEPQVSDVFKDETIECLEKITEEINKSEENLPDVSTQILSTNEEQHFETPRVLTPIIDNVEKPLESQDNSGNENIETKLETTTHESDSEDEVPLSNLLKDESNDQLTTSTPKNNNLEKKLEDFISPVVVDNETLVPEVDEQKLPEKIIEPISKPVLEKEIVNLIDSEKISKKKDVTVLMEINDNFCETSENLNSMNIPLLESNISKIERKILEDKLEEPLLVPVELPLQTKDFENNLNDSKDIDFIEKPPENQVSKLDKFNFFTNSNIDKVIWKESESEVITDEPINIIESNSEDDKKLGTDTSEYKENSILPVEELGKQKQRKRGNKSSNKNKTVEVQNKTESPKFNKKSSRIAKTKALESILDDVLLELSENELLPQDGLKNTDDTARSKKSPRKNRRVSSCGTEEKSIELPTTEIKELSTVRESIEEPVTNLNDSSNLNEDSKTESEGVKELRRSSRNSKKVIYNETDLIDPLLDEIENNKTISKIIKETTKDMFVVKKKTRKIKKNGENDRRLNGEELFDLLKTTPNENILPKPTNTFFNSFDEISNDFNDDNFDVFDDILEKSIAVIEENLSEKVSNEVSNSQINLSNDQSSDSNTKASAARSESKRLNKRRAKRNRQKNKSENSQNESIDFEQTSNLESVDTNDVSDSKIDEKNKIYCEICDKSFCRIESLTKHKRTLTHISKLSELEAKEAALKAKCDQLSTNEETEITHISSDSRKDLNLLDMLGNMNEDATKEYSPFSVGVNNSNLKLADIINDVLNKPLEKDEDDTSHNFPEIVLQSEKSQSEVRRCKSLAERKSFESENCVIQTKNESNKNVDYFESEISNAAAGTILEKQLTLLENIIENRTSLGYIDELSVSSSPSVNENIRENEILETKQTLPVYPVDKIKEDVKTNIDESFLKPTQYEEISEDSNLRNYEEQKSRKALNRDEELFLECCSLLKSGSEVSNYSKKSNNLSKNLELKRCQPDWLDNNCISRKENEDFVECYSDNSRMRTPLGDSFSQEDSNSATISSQWEMNNCGISKKENWGDDMKNKNLSFEEVFSNRKNDLFCGRDKIEELHTVVSSFDRVISEVLKTELKTNENLKTSSTPDLEEISRSSSENKESKDTVLDGKKVLTKGAMKVFEGLKVSIPTEELNMDNILVSNSSTKSPTEKPKQKSTKRNFQSPNKSSKAPKTKHKSPNFKKQIDMQMNSKTHDVYDFEETQDNSDVFTRPDFRSFRTNNEKGRKSEKTEGSDEDSQDCADNFSFDALSSSTSSVSEVLPVKSRNQQNITKKKCMIMGRIFKNAVKSRISDEDIRSIPVIDNTKLVEDFVMNCPEPPISSADKKPRMTEEEMNQAFDKLISSNSESKDIKTFQLQNQHKNNINRRRQRTRNKKRAHTGSDSSDDEFKLQKYSKKRHKRKNNNTEESCINLEQELRECIGVASRKSQRKCTSGKQNVLMEYWSSDESSFEAILEKKIIDSVQKNFSTNNDTTVKDSGHDFHKENEIEKNISNETPVVESVVVHNKKIKAVNSSSNSNRRKRVAANPLYHWSSSSEDESRDLIEIRPARDEVEDDEDRPVQHGWIVGDSPKKLVTMLAQAKGKKCEVDSVKEHGKKRTSTFS